MTKKDYQLIADTFAEAIKNYSSAEWNAERKAVQVTAILLSHRLKADNYKFDKTKFLTACGINENEW